MANLYFDESLEHAAAGDTLTLAGEEARHAIRVSRIRVGEGTIVGNGRGLLAHGTVSGVDRDSLTIEVNSAESIDAEAPRLVLVQALAKGDRDERAVEQATEFGVAAVQPWQAERSVSRWGDAHSEKAAKGRAKWARIAREASKQSMRPWIPEVLPLTQLAELCELASKHTVIVLHPRGSERLSTLANTLFADPPAEIYLVVGPEGGLSDDELDALETAGAQVSVLGKSVLRTSSAGPAALAVFSSVQGRW